jgi:hypothetical protein
MTTVQMLIVTKRRMAELARIAGQSHEGSYR